MSIVLLICMSAELLTPGRTTPADAKPARPATNLYDGIQLNPWTPPEQAEGKVIEVFDDSIVLISLGSKEETHKGMRVEFYRIHPKALYLGAGEVTAVGERYSLVRFAGKSPAIKVGDLVTATYSDPAPKR